MTKGISSFVGPLALAALGGAFLLAAAAFGQVSAGSAATSGAAWLVANQAWLLPLAATALTSILASVVTGLTRYPGADTGKVVKVLKVIMDLLSFLTHKDSPGTFGLPLTRSEPPVVNGVNVRDVKVA